MLQKLMSCLVFLIGSAVVPLCMQIQIAYNLIPDTCFQPLIYHNWIIVLGFTMQLVIVCLNRCTFLFLKARLMYFLFCNLICLEASALQIIIE